VLARFPISEEDMDLFEALWADAKRTELVAPTVSLQAVKDDPSDNKFLECALAGKADFIVSGYRHLLNLGVFQSIPILSPRGLLRRLG
jgi:predicted nucleic acid-binding protein